ncbi:MAG: DUF2127 domain-containing protein [Candidatus Dormibacteraeota bacterium]|nr:DUF2127 domain-containing protein [Candidatus Dormibacteraeota bacterium]
MGDAAAQRRGSWWHRFRSDLGLRIEHRGFVLWYLIVERGLKGVGLLVVALYLAAHLGSGLDDLANRVIEQFNLDSGSNFLQHAAFDLVLKFIGISHTSLLALAAGSFLYGVIEAAESVGLLLRRRWAEYLVVLATAFFIPLEVYEVAHRLTAVRSATLVINIAVVIYLVRRKRLFSFDEPVDER